jgi:hypothetical protein
MAETSTQTLVTPFMKELTVQKYNAIVSDVNTLLEVASAGLKELKRVIYADSSSDFKKSFDNKNDKNNVNFYLWPTLISGYTDSLYVQIRPGKQKTSEEIIKIYDKYFKLLFEAGSGSSYTYNNKKYNPPQYPVSENGILQIDDQYYKSSYSQYKNVKTQDSYGAAAIADYMFRAFLDREKFTDQQAETYLTSASKMLSDKILNNTQLMSSSYYLSVMTVPGAIGRLRAIKDKLQNYTVGENDFNSNPESDTADRGNTSQLESQFNGMLATADVLFDIEEYIIRKIPSSLYSNEEYKDNIKSSFYRSFIKNGEVQVSSNDKYFKNIWNRIKTSGLLDLAVSAASIGDFARKRFSVGNNLLDPELGSAGRALDPVRDTIWLNDLVIVTQNLSRDPLTLAIVQSYFPNLSTLFFNASAAAADYSGGSEDDPINNIDELAKSLLRAFGTDKDGKPIFKPAWELINTGQRIKSALEAFPFRENISPKTPDIFHLRLGASNFYVPPVSINVSSQFKTGSLTSGAIRQKNSPKFNAGYKETTISVKLFFPNYEEIWGLSIDGIKDVTLNKDFKIDFKEAGNEEKIDKFLSSLRGLVASFKYAPILPIKSHYLNTVHGISGVALSSMSISTIPNYPFALVVDLELLNFNHKPFLPMIKDFNQAVHWGKFRHYMGKAAGSLHSYINESFLLPKPEDDAFDPQFSDLPGDRAVEVLSNSQDNNSMELDLITDPYKDDVLTTNVIKEYTNGNNISLFIPERIQTKIFTPDSSSFRSDEERLLDDTGQSMWDSLLKTMGIDINQSAGYHRSLNSVVQTSIEGSVSPSARRIVLESIELITAGIGKDTINEKVYDFFAKAFVAENKSNLTQQEIDYVLKDPNNPPTQDYITTVTAFKYKGKDLKIGENNYSLKDVRNLFTQASTSTEETLNKLAQEEAERKANTTGRPVEDFVEQAKEDIARAFNVLVYNRFFKSGPIKELMEAKRLRQANYQFNEWEVPMFKVDLDPKAVIVNGVSVTLGNNLAKLQLQMQEEPTYQHIGGKDSYINISMTVFGEKELIKLRKVFEHINGLARIEHSTGVIGFMGIKNIVAALAGIKYVMPLSYEVNTIPNFPHVYDVRMSLVDFDIFQQQRETLSSKQQKDMIETFGTKRNPFLRIKQLWGAFNAYPDFPLSVKDSNGEVVGCLDPDYYFRSFEMFDDDIIEHLAPQQEKMKSFTVTPKQLNSQSTTEQQKNTNKILNDIKTMVQNNELKQLKEYFDKEQIGLLEASAYVEGAVREFFKGQKKNLLIDFIKEYPDVDDKTAVFGLTASLGSGSIKFNTAVGDLSYSDSSATQQIQNILETKDLVISEDGYLSIDPDELTIHHTITYIPAEENPSDDKMPAFLYHANGYHLGYVSKSNNRFYFTIDGVRPTKANSGDDTDGKINFVPIAVPFTDADDPSKTYKKGEGSAHIDSLKGAGSNLADFSDPYSGSSSDSPEVMSTQAANSNVAKHWERMLIDTKYRDISGRMIRAFPTYMLWLIDEGGYFSGVKLFDNFYGLQSIIDFSVVQSEDILGDTLILRVSNMYSKLTTAESTRIFDAEEEFQNEQLTQLDGIESVLDKALNRARNMVGHMENTYVVDINSIRLKPGVRVHLRGGYGANPNSLQTIFNGTITSVENGEIVTITAQSDAIELSPIVNSTNKKGDSGKIDGGINTGFWLSEPRDLMVRLLTMGSSRTREAIAHATRGRIFSENKFGIRHFGQILYEPLNDLEAAKNEAVVSQVKGIFDSLGEANGKTFGIGSAINVLATGGDQESVFGVGPEVRSGSISLMRTLWANFSSQRDFEIFKRNIYPGNGTGIAQFLGGDLGDGWSTIASITPEDKPNERLNYIGRLTDYSWNEMTANAGSGVSAGNTDAKNLIDANGQQNEVRNNNNSAGFAKVALSGAVAAAGIAVTGGLGAPIIGGILAGGGLAGVLSGRGGTNLFNAMGITSGLDDDLPGLDEVSFRAQTYMRTVWDLFQMCARLLPNYIVAVRPFEDRSTVFYGKPHWLYTSGVVPLTTGYPGTKRAEELGISSPKELDIDTALENTMKELNKNSNPMADASAFTQADSSLISIEDTLSQQMTTTEGGVYIPADKLRDNAGKSRVIAFGYKSTMEYRDNSGNAIAQIPESFGFATVGFHLPISTEDSTQITLDENQLKNHKQIDQLPLRYRFPFFTDRDDKVVLEDFAYYALADQLGKWENHKADYMTLAIDRWSYNEVGGTKEETRWVTLLKLESERYAGVSNTVDYSAVENANGIPLALKLNASGMPSFKGTETQIADTYIFQEKLGATSGSSVIRMPLPDNPGLILDSSETRADVYNILKNNPDFNSNAAGLRDWKAPKTPEDEQFYIAMRWPYKPSDGFSNESIEQFIQSQGGYVPVGNAKSYQERKVMVYSPSTGKAVVCRPAYYLWGQETVRIASPYDNTVENGNSTLFSTDKFGNTVRPKLDTGSHFGVGGTNALQLGKEAHLSAVVSPDAAYYLGMLNLTQSEKTFWSDGRSSKSEGDWHGAEDSIQITAATGIAPFPIPRKCYYAFVPDDMPVGVVPDIVLPVDEFAAPGEEVVHEFGGDKKIISFGVFKGKRLTRVNQSYSFTAPSDGDAFFEFRLADSVDIVDAINSIGKLEIAGNILGENGEFGPGTKDYFDLVKNGNYEDLDNLKNVLKEEKKDRSSFAGKRFSPIFDEAEPKSVEARKFYDEDYSQEVSVIAGNGRTLQQAIEIWDQFRSGYHTYAKVKEAFQRAYGLPADGPESEQEIGSYLSAGFGLGSRLGDQGVTTGNQSGRQFIDGVEARYSTQNADSQESTAATNKSVNNLFKNYGDSGGTAEDEFSLLFGDRFFDSLDVQGPALENGQAVYAGQKIVSEKTRQGLETARKSFIDNPDSSVGLISYFNDLLNDKLDKILGIIRESLTLSGVPEKEDQDQYIASIKTSRQLFLFMVGAFRNRMWSDPYARAWLVLKPNRKFVGDDNWDFTPVLKIFQAYIDPNEDYGKSKDKFTKLLAQNRSEGSSATNFIGKWGEDVSGFWDKNIGPLFTALGDSLSGLVNLFRMSMMQLGYGLSQVGQMSKQANILNKVLNDSIYYSLGRPGSLLRAVDNPFTREYAEPVIEIRQPFQRVHYLSSFSHILANGITENLNGVATMVTAVSDGKYPVTVAMDKSAPAERQVEKTVETGLFFDNATGSGLFGALHPILHPFEFARGMSKFAQGTPDEMLARRVALAHLKDSLKDIYTGEIVIIGNADIRPHDLVYLADVYERMYGMFEVEQVVHHFTSELGFVTSITPNALVTVNDPAKWFMSSWIGTWMHMQSLRNDTRLYMSSLGSGINSMSQISVDGLADSLQTQMVGGIQFTHGAAALTKDIMAHFSSEGINDINTQVKGLVAQGSAASSGQIALGGMGLMFAGATGLGATALGIASLAVPGAGLLVGGASAAIGAGVGGKLAWKGWSWMRDNVLDQHGCYIQYLNKNGKAMDSGLGLSGQGMVVGRYHTKKLLPGILGVSSKIKTAEGYSYIRTNDLLSKLGWKEKEINDLVRYIDFENALVNTQVLKYSGIGPEKAGLNRFFKVICKVEEIIDGDTIDVVDLLDTSGKKFRIRFDGINTPEINVISTDIHTSGKTANITNVSINSKKATITTEANHNFGVDEICVIAIDNPGGFYILNSSAKIEATPTPNTFVIATSLPDNSAAKTGKVRVYATNSGEFVNSSSPGGKAKMFTRNALKDKIFVLRVSPENVTASFTENDFEAGSAKSIERRLINGEPVPVYYDKDVYGERVLGVIFYKTPTQALETIIREANSLFDKYKKASSADLLTQLASSFSPGVFSDRYSDLTSKAKDINKTDYFTQYASSTIQGVSATMKQTYNAYITLRLTEYIYERVSEWPNVEWDEYYDDGTPVSLNWELVVNNLAKVYTKGMLIEQPSVIDSYENAAIPSQVTVNRNN